MIKKITYIMIMLFIPSLVFSASVDESFKLSLKKEGIATFSFEPSEILEFAQSTDPSYQAQAEVEVNWTIHFDTDKNYSLSLEANSSNESNLGIAYCLENTEGTIGLNYLIYVNGILFKNIDTKKALPLEDRSLILVSQENENDSSMIPTGNASILLKIPMPTDISGKVVNGVYQGFLILTLTYD